MDVVYTIKLSGQPLREMFANAELIDTILGLHGKGDVLLGWWKDIPTLIRNLDAADLTDVQRNKLRAVFKLQFIAEPRAEIRSPADMFNQLRDLSLERQEHFVVVCLDTRNRILSRDVIYKGSLNMSVIRIAEALRPAIIHNAAAVIVAHNHPSGDPSPSPEDVAVTRHLIAAGKQFDIEVLDHIIIGDNRYVSLKERGLAFE